MMLLLILVPIPNQSGMYVSILYPTGFSSPVLKNSRIRYPLFGELHLLDCGESSDVSSQKTESYVCMDSV